MPSGVRVVCNPLLSTPLEGEPFVESVSISLVQSGGTETLVTESPQPATLKLSLAYLRHARGAKPEHEPFAFLEGTLRRGDSGRPVFACAEGGFRYEGEDLSQSEVALRSIIWNFDPSSFEAAPKTSDDAALLFLPRPTQTGIRLAEITLALTVDGKEEASAKQNDVLDLCLGPEPMRLVLRFPETADTPLATFVLRRGTDGFEQIRHHGDDLIKGNDTVELQFDGILPDHRYALIMVTPQGRKRVLFNRMIRTRRAS